MRPMEILLVCAALLTLLVIAVPRLRAARWSAGIVLLTLILAVAQIALEGPRWQMVPAYALTGIILLVWLLQHVVTAGKEVQQVLSNRFVAGTALTLGIIGFVLSTALPIAVPVFQFPHPGGPYAIGTVTYHWTDTSRHEIFSTNNTAPRELTAQVWYPARKGSSSPRTPYLQDADTITTVLAVQHNFPVFLFQHLKYVMTNATESPPIANDRPSYRVLIALEGLTGYRQMLTFQVEELVSHGYIVVGIDQPGVATTVVFPDKHQIDITGRLTELKALVDQSLSPSPNAPQFNGQTFKDGIIPYFAQDVSFTLDQLAALNTHDPQGILTGKLDLEHSGVFGMSLGGMVGAQACSQEPRLKACLIVDVAMTADVVQRGLHQPSMWITRPADTMRLERQRAGGWAEKDIIQTQTTMRTVYNHLPAAGYFVQIPGAFHIDFTDLSALTPLSPMIGFSGPIGSQRAHDITNAYSVAFFDKHLKGMPETLLDRSPPHYPEVIFEKR
jgi:predicted dienelactone hydrolase